MKDELDVILERMSWELCMTCVKDEPYKVDTGIIKNTKAQILSLIHSCKPKKKEIIDIKKKMCHNLEYPTPCIYDEPTGGTCMEKLKENCKDYKDMQVEYETFEEWNSCVDLMDKNIDKMEGL